MLRIPYNPRTDAQQAVRKAYGRCVEEWRKLSPEEKASYEERARPLGISGWNLFVKERLPAYLVPPMDYEVSITEQSGQDLTDYQVLLVVDGDSEFFNTFNNDHKYLEVYDEDGKTLLKFWVEEWDPNNYKAKVWIKVPSIPASSTKKIYLKANLERAEPLSNRAETFDDFDDFSTDTLANYVQIDTGWSISNGILKSPGSQGFICKLMTLNRNYALRARIYVNGSDAGLGFIWGTEGGSEGSVNGYIANHHPDSSHPEWSVVRRYVDGGATSIADLPTVGSGWYIMEVRVTPNKVIALRNGTKDAEAEDTYFSQLQGIGFRQKASTDAVDWWDLRKYVEPEPSVTYTKLK